MRRNWLTIVALSLVFIGLALYLVTYTVRVDQVAAHYRLGEVKRIHRPTLDLPGQEGGQSEFVAASGVPVITEPGLYFKLPWPFDRVAHKSQKIRYVDGPLTQLQLPDENQLIPRVFAMWRVTDPVAFDKTLMGEERSARETIKQAIGSRTPEVMGRYNLDDLVNTDRSMLKFDQVEREIYEAVKATIESSQKSYGIEICSLGITWIALPEDATSAVFLRMDQERKTESERLVQEGQRVRRTTIAAAQQERDRILADAEAEAKRIRAEGEAEAAKSYDIFAKAPDLAIFLRRLEAFRKLAETAAAGGQPMTFVLSTQNPPFDILETGPLAGRAEPKLELPRPVAPQPGASGEASGGGE